MRNALLLALLVPALVLAGSNLIPVTKIDAEKGVSVAPVAWVDGQRPGTPISFIGTADTIGGTTYDWQTNGPSYRWVVNSVGYGLHAMWMFSADDTGGFADRNLRYNYYDYGAGVWSWPDPDFMQAGVTVYTPKVGYGNLDADPTTAVAIMTAHGGSPIHPTAARDMGPGAGIFEYCTGSPVMNDYVWPYNAVGQNHTIHVNCIDNITSNQVYYSQVKPWCTWSSAMGVAAPQPDPNFPDQGIAASKASDKVCLTWVFADGNPNPGFYRISTDGGATWGGSTELPWPAAFGTDTATSYDISSIFPFYDKNDKLHIVASVAPVVGGQMYVIPAQIWHWSPDNTPNWSHITTATCDSNNMLAPVGDNALYASRPTIGQDASGNLYVSWEQFDSSNVEPGPPAVLRADVFVAGSRDNGVTWGAPVKITSAGTTSCRFPSMVDLAYNDGSQDLLAVTYMVDVTAGFFVQGEGPATNNPVICQFIPTTLIGIAEPGAGKAPASAELSAAPNPFGSRTSISYALPKASNVSLVVYDASGRPVRALEQNRCQAGRYSVAWDGRSATGESVAAGIYFYTLNTDQASLSGKLTVVR